jgi:hypothetical protein
MWLIYGYYMVNDGSYIYIFAWWFEPTSLKNDGVKVSWDDDIPKRMESHNPVMFQTTNHFRWLNQVKSSFSFAFNDQKNETNSGHQLFRPPSTPGLGSTGN